MFKNVAPIRTPINNKNNYYCFRADDVRNMKFYEALKKAIVPNVSRVIDVGAGTMLLSMMAHDLGAANILGVEENRNMASVAREVLRVNKYTNNSKKGKIRLFEGSFEYLFVGHKQVICAVRSDK